MSHRWLLPAVFAVPSLTSASEDRLEDLFNLDLESLRQVRVTTSLKRETSQDASPGTLSVFTRRELQNLGVRTLDAVLNLVPGMRSYHFVGPDTGGKTVVETRGIYDPYGYFVLLLHNGQRLTMEVGGNATMFNRWLSLRNVERIEIIRGPGSALYGSNAMQAVINIITGSETGDHLFADIGSFGSYDVGVHGAHDSADWHWHYLMSAQGDDGDSYPTAFNRFADGSEITDPRAGWNVEASLVTRDFGLDLRMQQRSSDQFYQAQRPGDAATYSDTEQHHVRAYWQFQAADWQQQLSLAYVLGRWDVLARLSPQNAFFSAAPYYFGSTLETDEWHGNWDGKWQLAPDHWLSGGLSLLQAEVLDSPLVTNYSPDSLVYLGGLQTLDAIQLIDNTERNVAGAYLQYEGKWDSRWSLVAGARYDRYNDKWQEISPRLAVSYQLTPAQQVKAQIASAYRAPSVSDLSAGGNPIFVANSDVKPMTEQTVEAAWQLQQGWFSSTLTWYALEINDFIGAVLLPDGRTTTRNLGTTRSNGVEWDAGWQVHEHLLVKAGLAHVLDRDIDDLPDSIWPSTQFAAEDTANVAVNWSGNQWNANVSAWWYGGVEALPADNGDEVINFSLRYRANDKLIWQLSAHNLTDSQVLAAEPGAGLGTQPDGSTERRLPQRGRWLWLGLEWRW